MMAHKSRKRTNNSAISADSIPLRTAAYPYCPLIKDLGEICTLCPISEARLLASCPLSGDYSSQLLDQIVLLQHVIGEVNFRIERQKFLIESLGPNVQEGIITSQESEELRLTFESKQTELKKVRDQLLKKVQQIRNSSIF